MNLYTSGITFLYYQDFEYGSSFMKDILHLECVMDQGFAQVFEVKQNCYIGIVKISSHSTNPGNSLISLNTNHLEQEYSRIKECNVMHLTEIQHLEQIPLNSFFFDDKEGHHFEIQQFIDKSHLARFNS